MPVHFSNVPEPRLVNSMWAAFFISSLFLMFLLEVPGFAFSRLMCFSRIDSLLAAPLFSIALLEIISIIYSKLGFYASWVSLSLPCLLLALIFLLIASFSRSRNTDVAKPSSGHSNWLILFLYIGIAFVIATKTYVLPLDGPSSFIQDSDNSFHLAVIRSFIDSGDYSTVNVGIYHDVMSSSIISVASGFYPAAWHLLAALIASFSGQDVAFATNVTNYVMLVFILPSSVFLFLKTVFKEERGVVIAGALVLFAFNSFPWGTLISVSGPLFPNTLGLMLVPACAAIFISTIGTCAKRFSLNYVAAFLLGVLSLCFSHPNAIFTMAVLLAPFVVLRFSRWYVVKQKNVDSDMSLSVRLTSLAIPALLILVIWIVCFINPALSNTVSFTWGVTASHLQAIINVLALSFRLPAGNYLLALFVAIGFFALLRNKESSWLCFSYIFAAIIYIIGASSSGFLKHFLAGFWYTDPYRLGACASLMAIPLAAVGLEAVYSLALRVFNRLGYEPWAKISACFVCLIITMCALYVNDFNLPGFGRVYTGLGDYHNCSTLANDSKRDNLFDPKERVFCKRVAEFLEKDDSLIYNNADDGSAFAYPLYGLNLLYRRSAAEMLGNETSDNQTLRLHLDKLATNEDVQRILKENCIKYILDLDYGGEVNNERCYYGYYTWDKWQGINSIEDSTPGLKLLMSEDDMRLYEIDYSAFN